MLRTPSVPATCWFSSTLTLTIFSRPSSSPASPSSTGATARHGPHHGAQKSTSTAPVASRTSCLKLASVTACIDRLPSTHVAGIGAPRRVELGRIQAAIAVLVGLAERAFEAVELPDVLWRDIPA